MNVCILYAVFLITAVEQRSLGVAPAAYERQAIEMIATDMPNDLAMPITLIAQRAFLEARDITGKTPADVAVESLMKCME